MFKSPLSDDKKIQPRAKLFLSSPDTEGLFGGGKCRLLEAIETEGSIQGAARKLGRSYRKAWGDIRRSEQGLGRTLVIKSRGGTHGGGKAELTAFARKLVKAWEKYRSTMIRQMKKSYLQYLESIINDKSTGEMGE